MTAAKSALGKGFVFKRRFIAVTDS